MNLNTAQFYDDYWGGAACQSYLADKQLDEIAATIVRRFGAKPQRVVDLGGGVSRIARLAKAAGHWPIVLDFSLAAVDLMRNEGIEAQVVDLRTWRGEPLLYGANIVTCTEVLEHMEEPERIVQMAARLARRGFFTVPNACLGPRECETHLRMFTRESLQELLGENGWQEAQVEVMHRWLIAECVR